PQPFYLGIAVAVLGLVLSLFFTKETLGHAQWEARIHAGGNATRSVSHVAHDRRQMSLREVFALTSWKNHALLSCCQAGLVNNLNDGMSWGVYPLFFASFGLGVEAIGTIKPVYPAGWGALQVPYRSGGLSM